MYYSIYIDTTVFLIYHKTEEGEKMNGENLVFLLNTDFDVKNITVTPCDFEAGNRVEYKNGRKNNLLHFVTYGTRHYKVGDRRFEVKKGDILFIPRGTAYSCYTQNGCGGIGVCFDMAAELTIPADVYVRDSRQIGEQIEKMAAVYCTAPSKILTVKAMLFSALSLFAGSFDSPANSEYYVIKAAIDFISEHFAENLPVSVYADKCKMSESCFRKKFKKSMGISPIEYRNSLRFIEARRLYSRGSTMQEIAEKVGFYDAGFFSKAYKKQFGITFKHSI